MYIDIIERYIYPDRIMLDRPCSLDSRGERLYDQRFPGLLRRHPGLCLRGAAAVPSLCLGGGDPGATNSTTNQS